MPSTLHDLIRTATQAAQNQQAARTATQAAAAEIAARRGATPRQQPNPAGPVPGSAGGAS